MIYTRASIEQTIIDLCVLVLDVVALEIFNIFQQYTNGLFPHMVCIFYARPVYIIERLVYHISAVEFTFKPLEGHTNIFPLFKNFPKASWAASVNCIISMVKAPDAVLRRIQDWSPNYIKSVPQYDI